MGSAGLSAGRCELTGWRGLGALRVALRALLKASSDSPLLPIKPGIILTLWKFSTHKAMLNFTRIHQSFFFSHVY